MLENNIVLIKDIYWSDMAYFNKIMKEPDYKSVYDWNDYSELLKQKSKVLIKIGVCMGYYKGKLICVLPNNIFEFLFLSKTTNPETIEFLIDLLNNLRDKKLVEKL